jgi:hypothetical protein
MVAETTTFDEYRTGYIAERHNVPDNCARALQLFEMGYSASGAAKHLDVTKGTVKSYLDRIEEQICLEATFSLGGSARDGSLDVWGNRDISEYENASYKDGKADAQRKNENEKETVPKELISPQFSEPERPRNKGVRIEEIPDKLINIKTP